MKAKQLVEQLLTYKVLLFARLFEFFPFNVVHVSMG